MNNRTKMIAFSLMLAVPATLSGCGNDYDDDCQYDQNGNAYNCNTHSSYYGGSSYSKKVAPIVASAVVELVVSFLEVK